METYKEFSISFGEMLSRTKNMRNRQNELKNIMSDYSLIPHDQLLDMQLELEGIQLGLKYREFENKRTVIMLKISLYKQKMGKIKFTSEKSMTHFNINSSSENTQSHIEIQNQSILLNSESRETHSFKKLTSTNTNTETGNGWPLKIILMISSLIFVLTILKSTGRGTITKMGIG